jgi:hypothetical protein
LAVAADRRVKKRAGNQQQYAENSKRGDDPCDDFDIFHDAQKTL